MQPLLGALGCHRQIVAVPAAALIKLLLLFEGMGSAGALWAQKLHCLRAARDCRHGLAAHPPSDQAASSPSRSLLRRSAARNSMQPPLLGAWRWWRRPTGQGAVHACSARMKCAHAASYCGETSLPTSQHTYHTKSMRWRTLKATSRGRWYERAQYASRLAPGGGTSNGYPRHREQAGGDRRRRWLRLHQNRAGR